MTLIAGFRSYGMPVLIGDFLITSGDVVSGLRKKVLLVADNFALAWTGHLFAADSVVKSLQSSLDLAAVTLESVRAILTDPDISPKELFLGEPMDDGSGDLFAKALAGTGLRDSSAPDGINQNALWKAHFMSPLT